MKIAFQMDPMEKIKFSSDTSWQLMIEGASRGEIYHFTPQQLSWNNGELQASVRRLYIDQDHNYKFGDQTIMNLTEMDIIFIRQDPPYDMAYLTATYLLEKISDQVLMINDPKAIRDFPEKISVLDYPNLIPASMITYSYQEALAFAKNYQQVIIKPLYSFAGDDVFCLSENDMNFQNIMDNLIQIHKTPVIIQKFLPNVVLGDKRIILIDGEPVGCFLRQPKAGDIRANLACGGKAIPSELTDREREICRTIKSKLVDNGLFLAGIDVIDGYLTEINITSPTGIVPIKEYYDANVVKKIWNMIEDKRHS